MGIAVFSHRVLDWIVHSKDLPLAFGDDVHVGLFLWQYPVLSYSLETIMLATFCCMRDLTTLLINITHRHSLTF